MYTYQYKAYQSFGRIIEQARDQFRLQVSAEDQLTELADVKTPAGIARNSAASSLKIAADRKLDQLAAELSSLQAEDPGIPCDDDSPRLAFKRRAYCDLAERCEGLRAKIAANPETLGGALQRLALDELEAAADWAGQDVRRCEREEEGKSAADSTSGTVC